MVLGRVDSHNGAKVDLSIVLLPLTALLGFAVPSFAFSSAHAAGRNAASEYLFAKPIRAAAAIPWATDRPARTTIRQMASDAGILYTRLPW
jgi:hypothetical protein